METTRMLLLIVKFEGDIKFDAHGTMTKFCRSKAAGELIEAASPEMLTVVLEHLRQNPPPTEGPHSDLPLAWCYFLHDLRRALDIEEWPGAESTPFRLNDWIAGLERYLLNLIFPPTPPLLPA